MPERGGSQTHMRTIKLIHAADFHLDSPYQSLSASKAAVCRQEQSLMLQRLIDLAEEESADLMLLAGDLLDSANTRGETGEVLLRQLGRVPCPVVIAPGSLDWFSDRSPWARLKLPENVTVFREQAVRMVSIPSASVRVYGAAFTDRTAPALLRGFHAERKSDVYNLLCMHGEVGNPQSLCNPITDEDLAASGIDYAALGHNHTASGLRRSGGCSYAWPGCPQGHGFDECGERGVYVVTLSPEGCSLRPVSIAVRQYRTLELDITGKDPLLLIHTSLPDDSVRDVYRITLTGESALAPDLRKLHQNLDEMFFSLQLKDRTRLPEEIWTTAGNDSLRGLFLDKLRTLQEAAQTDAEKQRLEQAARWGLAALTGGEEVAVHENP